MEDGKMADTDVTCDGCQRFVGSCVETLHCGHYLCGACSCKMESVNIICPLCEGCETEGCETEDCEILSCFDELSTEGYFPVKLSETERLSCVFPLEGKDMCALISSKEGSLSHCRGNTGMSLDDNVGSNIKQCESENDVKHVVVSENTISDDFKDNISGRIDEALVIANETVHHLNAAMQTLQKLDARNKLMEESVSSLIQGEFEKVSLALHNRKSYLVAELSAICGIYTADLQKAAKNIEEQKKCLHARVAFAEGLKQSPLVTVYCDLTQLVADLKVDFTNECMIDTVKVHPDVRFSINSDTIIKLFEKLGKIYKDGALKSQLPPDVSGLLSTSKESYHLDIKPEHRRAKALVTEYKAKGLMEEQYQTDLQHMIKNENDTKTKHQRCSGPNLGGPQESSLFSLKNNPLPQSLCSPDVIIEEIIEDDQPNSSDLQSNSTDGYHNKGALFKRVPFTESNNCKPKKFKKSLKKMSPPASVCQKKISQELVYLSYVVNPCDFYVHRFAQKRQIIMLERMLSSLSRTSSHCYPTDIMELGEIIAFKSTEHHAWCRGSITELIPLESKCIRKSGGQTRYKIEDILRMTLFLLDYGSSEVFVVARFAGAHLMNVNPVILCQTKVYDLCSILTKLFSTVEDGLRSMPPFAVHCSLDIVPQSPDGVWTKEIRDHILRVVNNKCVLMKIFREENKMLIVDLKKPLTNKINCDMPVSLRDSLVFLELAKFPSKVSPALSDVVVTQYGDPLLPEIMTEVIVIVCHMNDPSDFYIHMIGGSEYAMVVNRVQEVYNSEEADNLKILCPVMGQACIAKYDLEDDQWYRAEVIGIPSPPEVDIKYVDFGNVARVEVLQLKKLKEEFLALPRKAICCRLAYIQPVNVGPQWSSEACRLFEELTSCKRLRCTSLGVLLDNKLSVELFDPGKATSINAMLVNGNVASFIPCTPVSDDQHLPLKEIWDTVADLSLESVAKCMDAISLFEQKELDVFISHVISPSRIYVQWLSTENILKSLQANMFEKYEASKPEPVQWQVDMHVAVQLAIDKRWMRGKIRNISENIVEVFCYDFGMEEVTDVINLRTLDESLKIYGTMCLECSLMDIQPAGGCQNWTATACDFLCYYLNGAIATMIIEDNASQWPLPVRIFSKNEAGQLVNVSDYLIRKGLALRDRRLKKHDSLMEVNETTKLSDKADDLVEEVIMQPESDKTVTSKENSIPVSEEPMTELSIDGPYLPPLLPNEKTFMAKVSYVAEDGTIHIIPESLENELGLLMLDIQNSFKCLGLMAPYSWKKGEGCLIKGSDTMSYRGKVLEILGGDMIKVQYEDFGYTEKIPKCHLYPTVFNANIPSFCIPCQLNDILPVGDNWQPDAIQFLKELLLERIVSVHIVEPPKCAGGISSIYLYCGNSSVSAILEQYAHCIPKDYEKKPVIETHCITKISHENIWKIDFLELLQADVEMPLFDKYSLPSLPRPGELFPVKITHLQTPNHVFISIENEGGKHLMSDSNDGDQCSNFDPLKSSLKKINHEADTLLCLTDFKTEMPCLATYNDGFLHRAKLLSIKSYDPVTCVVEFVDYGSTLVLETGSLFQLPACLIRYPVKAIKVKLAGFKPPKEDFETEKLPYCHEWSLKALYDMIDLVQGKTLFATFVAGAQEKAVFLYDENQYLVHKPLVTMGLAELD